MLTPVDIHRHCLARDSLNQLGRFAALHSIISQDWEFRGQQIAFSNHKPLADDSSSRNSFVHPKKAFLPNQVGMHPISKPIEVPEPKATERIQVSNPKLTTSLNSSKQDQKANTHPTHPKRKGKHLTCPENNVPSKPHPDLVSLTENPPKLLFSTQELLFEIVRSGRLCAAC